MILNKGTAEAVYQNLKKDFEYNRQQVTPQFSSVYKTVSSNGAMNVYGFGDFIPGFTEWYEGQPRKHRNVIERDFVVQNRKFEKTIDLRRTMIEDNQLGTYQGLAAGYGQEAGMFNDVLIREVMESNPTCYDGKAFFANDHEAGLQTIDNLVTTALDETNLKAAITQMKSFKFQADADSEIYPLNQGAKLLLIVPTALEFTARELVKNPFKTGGANNVLYNAAELLVADSLTDANDWYLINVNAPIKPFFIQKREKLSMRMLTPMTSDNSFEYDVVTIGAQMRRAALPTIPWYALKAQVS